MAALDWIVVALFLGSMLAIGFWFSSRASGSMADFFVSGGKLPWWLAGTSILATSFASDTPLHVSKVIREQGLAGAWFYWSGILFAPMMAFFFAKLWRRAAVITDVEFLELRYAGRPATVLRGFMAVYRALIMAALTMGWVIVGMKKVVHAIVQLPDTVPLPLVGDVASDTVVVFVLVLLAITYTAASGLWGVVTTDLIEFVIAIGGAVALAFIAVDRVGGIAGLKQQLSQLPYPGPTALEYLPRFGSGGVSTGTFLVYVLVLGWASAEVDGSGNKAQRFLACKDERHSLASGLWSLSVQNIIRSWPWYIAALCGLVLFPSLTDNEMAYPRMIAELLPAGVKGLMVAAFLAAFLSTIDTHLNLGASYLVNDVYRRFLRPRAAEPHYVRAARVGVLVMALVAAVIALNIGSVLGALKLKGELAAGMGLVIIFRWYWWRVSPWSEIAAMAASVISCALLHVTGVGVGPVAAMLGIDVAGGGDPFPARILIIVGVSTLVWVAVTLLGKPAPTEHLVAFYRRVRPAGRLWGPVARRAGAIAAPDPLSGSLLDWGLTTTFVLCGMFALGKFLLGFPVAGALLALLATATGALVYRRVFSTGGGSAQPPQPG